MKQIILTLSPNDIKFIPFCPLDTITLGDILLACVERSLVQVEIAI